MTTTHGALPFTAALLLLLTVACGEGGTVSISSSPSVASATTPEKGDLVQLDAPTEGRYFSSADARGDATVRIDLTTTGFAQPAFAPTIITGSPGEQLSITIVQSNRQAARFRHSFSIDSLGISVDIPAGLGHRRTVSVTLPERGTLVFYCRYHYPREFHAGALRAASP